MFQGSSGGRADDPQDERDAAAGEHRAGRPDEGAALPEGDRDLEDGAGQDRRQDLRDADAEVQPDLAEDVDRDDHRRDMQARVADARQDERVGGAADVSVRDGRRAGDVAGGTPGPVAPRQPLVR